MACHTVSRVRQHQRAHNTQHVRFLQLRLQLGNPWSEGGHHLQQLLLRGGGNGAGEPESVGRPTTFRVHVRCIPIRVEQAGATAALPSARRHSRRRTSLAYLVAVCLVATELGGRGTRASGSLASHLRRWWRWNWRIPCATCCGVRVCRPWLGWRPLAAVYPHAGKQRVAFLVRLSQLGKVSVHGSTRHVIVGQHHGRSHSRRGAVQKRL